MPKRLHQMPVEDSMSPSERKQWLGQERYFRYSWTHAFYNWKRHRIMAGKKVRKVLLEMSSKRRRVIELGCGSGEGLFDVYDVCSDIEGIKWFGLDLNYSQINAGKYRSQFRVSERKTEPIRLSNICLIPLSHLQKWQGY
jgi:SAM-dependent methyltransferase